MVEDHVTSKNENVAKLDPIVDDDSTQKEVDNEAKDDEAKNNIEIQFEMKTENLNLQEENPESRSKSATDQLEESDHDPILNPYFSGASHPQERVGYESESPMLIKKQSKDEATEILTTTEEKQRAAEVPAPKEPIDVLQALNSIIKTFVPAKTSHKFDLDEFRDKLFFDNQYSINKTWYHDHAVMSCPAKHFLERFSVQGEFFEKYDWLSQLEIKNSFVWISFFYFKIIVRESICTILGFSWIWQSSPCWHVNLIELCYSVSV